MRAAVSTLNFALINRRIAALQCPSSLEPRSSSMTNIPYTYLIGWTEHNLWYYGVRYAEAANPKDFWKTYFTSSKLVGEIRKQYGEPDIAQIRRTFGTANCARLWEHKVLRRMKGTKHEKWLNRTDAISFPIMPGSQNPFFGKKHNTETLKLISCKSKEGAHLKQIPCKLCNTLISKHNMSRHLYFCSGGTEGTKANPTRNGIVMKKWGGKTRCITDGNKTKRIPLDTAIPLGWHLGRHYKIR